MSGIIKVAVLILVWEFTVGISFIVANVTIYEYVEPAFDDVANQTSAIDMNHYNSWKAPVLMGFDIALFILAILPFVYLFVRVLLKREQTAPAAYPYPTYQVNPELPGGQVPRGVNSGGHNVGI